MASTIESSVHIEVFIEGYRDQLFEIATQDDTAGQLGKSGQFIPNVSKNSEEPS
jgi:hypothetical protein